MGPERAANRPGFFLPPEMVGGESRLVAIDFTISGWSHSGPLAVADDSRDWRKRLFRWTCFARDIEPEALSPGFVGSSSAVAAQTSIPTARAAGLAQDIQFGFGQSFGSDVNDPPLNGGMAMLLNPSSAQPRS